MRSALEQDKRVSLSEKFHFRYVDIVGTVDASLQFFCIVRNPWSQTASRYQYAKQQSRRWSTKDPRRLYIERASFADYILDRKILRADGYNPIGHELSDRPWMGPMLSWFNQLDWIKDEEGCVVCDC